jgi:hypothetical protein
VSNNVVMAQNTISTSANGRGVNMQLRTTQCNYNPPYSLPPARTDGTPLCCTNIVTTPPGSHTVLNIDVYDKTVTSTASLTGGIAPMAGMSSDINTNYPATAPLVYTSQNIHFHDNSYCMPSDGNWFTWSYDTEINQILARHRQRHDVNVQHRGESC